jgi:hypothetical protein
MAELENEADTAGAPLHVQLPTGEDVLGEETLELLLDVGSTNLVVPVVLTAQSHPADTARSIIATHNVPVHQEAAVLALISSAVDGLRQRLLDARDDELLAKNANAVALAEQWESLYLQEHRDYLFHAMAEEKQRAQPELLHDLAPDLPFSAVFHDTIHSPFLVRRSKSSKDAEARRWGGGGRTGWAL